MVAVAIYSKCESRTSAVKLFESREAAIRFLEKDAEEYYESLCEEERGPKGIVKEIVSEYGHATVGKWGTMEKTYTWDVLKVS